MKSLTLKLVGVLIVILVWFLTVDVFKLTPATLLPAFGSCLEALYNAGVSGDIETHLLATLERWALGVAIGAFVGIPFGLILGSSKTLRDVFDIPVEFVRAIPVTAMIPLFFLLFGVGDAGKIAMTALPCFLLLTVNTSLGIQQTSPLRRQMAKIHGLSRGAVFWRITFPESSPHIATGLRLAISVGLVVVVITEMFIGTSEGVGLRIYESYMTGAIAVLYSWLIIIGWCGYFLACVLSALEKKYIIWTGK